MCGLVGAWNYASGLPVPPRLLEAMRDTLTHRGPDAGGSYFDPEAGLGFGFRRLSILDLSSAANQPLANEDESVWMMGNGEIYNFVELREQLESRRHRFRSRTDMEVVVHLYEERGEQLAGDLSGMFALAIWDRRLRRLLLVRDRLGKKPLYYHDDGRRVLFASELKGILADPSVPRDLDLDAVAEFFTLGYVAAPRSIFRGIAKLGPARALVFEGRRRSEHRYWDWRPAFGAAQAPPPAATEQEWLARIRDVLTEAVRSRMRSDVPLGVFLSGGVDSSAVTAVMARLSDRPVKTFSIGFQGSDSSDLPHARLVSQALRTEHREFIVEPETAAAMLPRLARQFDEPFGDSSALPTYYVSKLAREHVTVCLSGDGGDEAMAGYERYALAMRSRRVDRVPLLLRKAVFGTAARLIPPYARGRQWAQRMASSYEHRYALRMKAFSADQARQALTPDFAACVRPLAPAFATAFADGAGLDPLSLLQYVDARTYLPDDILVKVDRASMMNSLEVRCPLLDHRFLELAASIPAGQRLVNGEGKHVFKQALRGWVPDPALDRRKQGFGIPGYRWLGKDRAGFMTEVLTDPRTARRGVLRKAWLRDAPELARSVHPSLWEQTWLALVFELWCRAYLDR